MWAFFRQLNMQPHNTWQITQLHPTIVFICIFVVFNNFFKKIKCSKNKEVIETNLFIAFTLRCELIFYASVHTWNWAPLNSVGLNFPADRHRIVLQGFCAYDFKTLSANRFIKIKTFHNGGIETIIQRSV